MLESFSIQAMHIIEHAQKIASDMNHQITGTEHLLLAMYETPDAICRFLFEEQDITKNDLLASFNKIVEAKNKEGLEITPKDKLYKTSFTERFQNLMLDAENLIITLHKDLVFDEHLFYVMLQDKASTGSLILLDLGLNLSILMNDVEDIYNFNFNNNLPYLFITNLKTKPLTHPFYERNHYLDKLTYILNKKQKNNPLLIGSAGVGKTIIVHALAQKYPQTIYQLDLGKIVAGTKYRGELEDKLQKALDYIKSQQGIVFIDEIHNIVGSGANEGSLDIANILKPYLSADDLSLIGATTIDEYYKYFEHDKALMRRFQNIYITEPSIEETKDILNLIKGSYEKYHNVKYSLDNINEIINKTSIYFPNKAFPDKAIDILDEVGARKKINHLSIKTLISETINDMTGLNIIPYQKLNTLNLHYPILKPHYLSFMLKLKKTNNLLIANIGKDFNKDLLITDLKQIFNLQLEMVLELDLQLFHDEASINNLIGSSKGYVGYDQGGILTEHIYKYPLSLVILYNYDDASTSLKVFFEKLFKTDYILDNKGRKVYLTNTIFLKESSFNQVIIGYENTTIKSKPGLFLETKRIVKTKQTYQKILDNYHIKITNWSTFYHNHYQEANFEESFINLITRLLLTKTRVFYIFDDYSYKMIKPKVKIKIDR